MRVLVTGGNGQVGYCVSEQLSHRPDVTLLVLDKEGLDVTNPDSVREAVLKFSPDVIINCAAYTAVDKAEQELELAYAVNAKGPKYLAKMAQTLDVTLIHISTDYVFEGNMDIEHLETDETNPQGIYGKSKLAGEQAVIEECDKHIILRTAWVFGEKGNNFVKTMCRLAEKNDCLSIVGDQFGGPTYAGDIASTLIRIADKEIYDKDVEYGIYHFSGLPHVSWFEFAQTIFSKAKKLGIFTATPTLKNITTEQFPTPAKRPVSSKLSTDKIERAFSIKASDWKSALDNVQIYTRS